MMPATVTRTPKRNKLTWRPIATAPKEVVRWRPVDLWMQISASPMSMGMSDSFRVADCWRDDSGKWVHLHNGEVAQLNEWYITHWMPLPEPPMTTAEIQSKTIGPPTGSLRIVDGSKVIPPPPPPPPTESDTGQHVKDIGSIFKK